MDKEIAKKLISLAVSTDRIIAEMLDEIDEISNEEMKSKLKIKTEDLMGYIARDVIFPLTLMFPDLDPDK